MNYETKDSGKRAAFANGGVRDTNEGKLRLDLVMPKNVPFEDQLLIRWAELMARGAEKYSDRNWEQFSDEEARDRAKESALRHFMQWYHGFTDEDHGAAVLFNIGVADYVNGVLDGRWPALKDSNAESEGRTAKTLSRSNPFVDPPLWKGTSGGEEPPARVKRLRNVNGNTELVRQEDNTWRWERKDFSISWPWAQWLLKGYHFVEVRD